MKRIDLLRGLARPGEGSILYFVVDGLGGLPATEGGPTELEAASTPTMDRLARRGEIGLSTPVLPGITPGSGPAHLALFGYDPVEVRVGRGILSALGIGAELRPGDVAARINLCTLDEEGRVTDRRAGRIESDEARPLVERLDGIDLGEGIVARVLHVKEYRACVVLRSGEGDGKLDGRLADTDPQETGVPPREPRATDPAAEATARRVARFVDEGRKRLADQKRANGLLLRGFDTFRPLPELRELYGLEAAAVAAYPMYRGVARLVGMKVVEAGGAPDEIVDGVSGSLPDHDFVYVHYKYPDSRGEDGDFDGKVAEIEKADRLLERLLEEEFLVVMVTGDHSTPSRMRSHSWHPVPLLIHGPAGRGEPAGEFGETACRGGALGRMRALDVLPLVLAHAGRLGKYGA